MKHPALYCRTELSKEGGLGAAVVLPQVASQSAGLIISVFLSGLGSLFLKSWIFKIFYQYIKIYRHKFYTEKLSLTKLAPASR